MTICIAALADNGGACVVAADRQVTVHALSLQFEHSDKKIDTLVNGCVVLSSGDALLAAEVIEKARSVLGGLSHPTIQQMAECLRDTYMSVHLMRAENVILRPRGLTFQEWGGTKIPLQLYIQIDQLLFNFGIGAVEFLVAGIDASGAHIFRVHYSGIAGGNWLEFCTRLSYRTIGSGLSHAAILLSMENQNRTLGVGETLYNVYCAKKNSEVAPGVGPATDIGHPSGGQDRGNRC